MNKFFMLLCACLLFLTSCQKQEPSGSIRGGGQRKSSVPDGIKTELITPAPIKQAPMPMIGNSVAVHYQAWLRNRDGSRGRMVDTSYTRQEPLKFTIGLGEVIHGFELGVCLMKIGEKRRLIISPELAYGEKGMGMFIPPNATLEFEVVLLGFS